MIAGKIIPTIMTTTATVAGHVSDNSSITIELSFDEENNTIIFYYYTIPDEITYTVNYVLRDHPEIKVEGGPLKCIPNGFTIWDRLEIKGPKTGQEFLDEMAKKYGIDIDFLLANGKLIISTMDDDKTFNEKKKKLIEELYLSVAEIKPKENINYLLLQLSANIKKVTIKNQEFQDVAVEMPPIKYIYK